MNIYMYHDFMIQYMKHCPLYAQGLLFSKKRFIKQGYKVWWEILAKNAITRFVKHFSS